ncbi:type II secretion system F family protein [Actinokineospora inagensis]|uniref:type II secretion system F family protein n=1 Tax=Actinokineospora inagensis TaxID=103730 RepID=UPI00041187F2|nr:type II secretion system F family protein [Actinokineospora inagensis]
MTFLLIAAAVMIAGADPHKRRRFRRVHGLRVARGRTRPRREKVDESRLAVTWDLLAACLIAGMPVSGALRAVADQVPGRPGAVLDDVADQLALGADARQAWATAVDCAEVAGLARAARRTARSGAGLAAVARGLAADVRERSGQVAEARAQRAAVLVTLPLGLCFLPAFLCVGVVPVVIGMTAPVFH